jgi:hypothetical protein
MFGCCAARDADRKQHSRRPARAASAFSNGIVSARTLLEERLTAARRERVRRVAALLDEWDAEDAASPDLEPLPLGGPFPPERRRSP